MLEYEWLYLQKEISIHPQIQSRPLSVQKSIQIQTFFPSLRNVCSICLGSLLLKPLQVLRMGENFP